LTDRAAALPGADRGPVGRGHARRHGHGKSALSMHCSEPNSANRSFAANHNGPRWSVVRHHAELLGIDPASVEWIKCDLPALRDLVLIDCPIRTRRKKPPSPRLPTAVPRALGPLRRSYPSATCCWSPHATEVSQRRCDELAERRRAPTWYSCRPRRSGRRHPR